VTDRSPLGAGLARVAAALGGATLRLTGSEGEARRRTLHTSITGYLLPKVSDPSAAIMAVLVGPSGSGKSTLINAMAGHAVAATGPLRPTTRHPAVWAGDPLPPGLLEAWPLAAERVTGGLRRPPEGLVVVDAPPPGVVSDHGIEIDALLLEIADVCVFVASERRYADATAWRLLEIAARRRMPGVFVLNRLTGDPETQRILRGDMAKHLVRLGLLDRLEPEGVIGIEEAGAPTGVNATMLRKELENMADPQARHAVVTAGIEAGIADVQRGLIKLRESVVIERRRNRHLLRLATEGYGSEITAVRSAIARGEMAGLSEDQLRLSVDLASIITRRAAAAARRTAAHWDAHPVGRSLLGAEPGLWMHGQDTPRRARDLVAAWSASLPGLAVRRSGRPLRRRWRRRIADAARRAALDPAAVPSRRIRRRVERIPGLIDAARAGLGDAVAAALEFDRSRFDGILGPEIPDSIEERLWLHTDGDR
jgi:energy-coupling factor transporter ATP-binding protein EcfA2